MNMIESMYSSLFEDFADYSQRIYWDHVVFREKETNYENISIPLAALVKKTTTTNCKW